MWKGYTGCWNSNQMGKQLKDVYIHSPKCYYSYHFQSYETCCILLALIHILKINSIPLGAKGAIDTELSVNSYEIWNVSTSWLFIELYFISLWTKGNKEKLFIKWNYLRFKYEKERKYLRFKFEKDIMDAGIPITWGNNWKLYAYMHTFAEMLLFISFSAAYETCFILLAWYHILKLNCIPLGAKGAIDTGLSVNSYEIWNVSTSCFFYWTQFYIIGNQRK